MLVRVCLFLSVEYYKYLFIRCPYCDIYFSILVIVQMSSLRGEHCSCVYLIYSNVCDSFFSAFPLIYPLFLNFPWDVNLRAVITSIYILPRDILLTFSLFCVYLAISLLPLRASAPCLHSCSFVLGWHLSIYTTSLGLTLRWPACSSLLTKFSSSLYH